MHSLKLYLLSLLFLPFISVAQNFEWLQWSPDPGQDSDYDNFNAIATDPFGNTYMAVQFSGILNVGEYSFQSNTIEDICILKYDASGQFIWAKAMGSLYWDQVNGMDCDASGNLYLTGHYFCEFWYEDTSLYGYAGGREMFLMKIEPDGDVAWAVNGANVWDEEGTDVRALPGGGVVMSGRANNTAMIGNLQLNHPVFYMQEFIACFDDDGVGQWIRSCGPSGSSSLYYSNSNLEIAPDSSIFIGYTGYGEIVMNGDTIRPWYYPEFSANYDVVMQRWSHEGDPIWGWVGGSLGQDLYGDIGVDPQGRLYATINSPMDVVFDNVTMTTTPGYWSSTTLRWNADGTEDISWHWLSSGFTTLQSVVCDDQGNTWAGGTLRDSLYMSAGIIYTPTINHRHGLLYMINGQSDMVERVDLITGEGWRTVAALEFNPLNGNIHLGGSATAGPAAPTIYGLGADISEGFATPGNWAYLASYGSTTCASPLALEVSDSLLCPGQSASISYPESIFFPTWNNGSTDPSTTVNAALEVLFSAIGSAGCVIQAQAEIAQTEAMQFAGSVTALQCNGSGDGAIDINVTSGVEPITFNWSNGQETEDLSELSSGTYQLQAITADGCSASQSFAVTQPQVINGTITEDNGVLTLNNVTGGTPPFAYVWNDFDNETGLSVSIDEAGTYSVTITDANNCQTTESILATSVERLDYTDVLVGPNPSKGQFIVTLSERALNQVDFFTLQNIAGQTVLKSMNISDAQNIQHVISGLYVLQFWDDQDNLVLSRRLIVE